MEHVNDLSLTVRKKNNDDKIIALAGNPNVGKSTVFNQLTGLKQHTGNWPGKTVVTAYGHFKYGQSTFTIVDLPGCYSLIAHSAEEEAARDFICTGNPDAVIVVCDATCLERNLNLVLQTIEITPNVVVCVNLIDEAEKKEIAVDLNTLSQKLGVPAIGCVARSKQGLDKLLDAVNTVINCENKNNRSIIKIKYPEYIEESILALQPALYSIYGNSINLRRAALSLLGLGCKEWYNYESSNEIMAEKIKSELLMKGITEKQIEDDIVVTIVKTAEEISSDVIDCKNKQYKNKDFDIDRLLTGRLTAFPIMLLALLGVFWLTITGANYPSRIISNFLFTLGDKLLAFFISINVPSVIYEPVVHGVYRVLAWVVSVMLPPMAIFFPLFTLLEDIGFLPRIAFNLDKCFKKCNACGKQALTMWIVNSRIFLVDVLA